MILGLIYAIPIFVIYAITYGSILLAAFSGSAGHMDSPLAPGWAPNIGLVLLMFLVEIAVGLIVPVASIRFARTNRFSEASTSVQSLQPSGKSAGSTISLLLSLLR